MSVSVFSFWMAMLCSTVLILLVHLLRKKPGFIRSFGVSTLLFLYFLCFFRMVVPLELPFVQVIGLEKGYAALFELARAGEVALQGFQLNLLELLCILWVGVAVCRFLYFVGRYLWEKESWSAFSTTAALWRNRFSPGCRRKAPSTCKFAYLSVRIFPALWASASGRRVFCFPIGTTQRRSCTTCFSTSTPTLCIEI